MRGVLRALLSGLEGVLTFETRSSLGGTIFRTEIEFLLGVGVFDSAFMSFETFGVADCTSGRDDFRETTLVSFLNSKFEAAACNDVDGIFSLPFALRGRGSNAGIIKSCKEAEEEASPLTTFCFLEVEKESSCTWTSFCEY
jgi:hypothetical protein